MTGLDHIVDTMQSHSCLRLSSIFGQSSDISAHRLQEERAFWTELVREGSANPYRRKSPRISGLLKMHEELVRLLDAQNVRPNPLLRPLSVGGACRAAPWVLLSLATLGAFHLEPAKLVPLEDCFLVQDHDWSLLKIQPMVVPPLPWRSIDSGGLLFTPQKVMRTRTEAQLRALQEADAALPNGMRKVLAQSTLC